MLRFIFRFLIVLVAIWIVRALLNGVRGLVSRSRGGQVRSGDTTLHRGSPSDPPLQKRAADSPDSTSFSDDLFPEDVVDVDFIEVENTTSDRKRES